MLAGTGLGHAWWTVVKNKILWCCKSLWAIGHVHQCLAVTGAMVGKSQMALIFSTAICFKNTNVTFSEALPASLPKMGRLFLCPVVYSYRLFCASLYCLSVLLCFLLGLGPTAATLSHWLREDERTSAHMDSDASFSTGLLHIASTTLPCRFETGSSYQRVLRREEQVGFLKRTILHSESQGNAPAAFCASLSCQRGQSQAPEATIQLGQTWVICLLDRSQNQENYN